MQPNQFTLYQIKCVWQYLNDSFDSRSESPSQVFIFTIYWLYEILSQRPVEEWGDVILAYDNMCQLDSLKVARSPLPLDPPYDQMWQRIKKV